MPTVLPATAQPVADAATTTLDTLAPGERATVLGVGGGPLLRRRLLELGLCGEVAVQAVRRAPLGDPVDYLVRGYHLSLRREQAAAVRVRRLAD